MANQLESRHDIISDVESDARPPGQKYPWEDQATSSWDKSVDSLTLSEEGRMKNAIGQLTLWLGGSPCSSCTVPEDVRSLVEKLNGPRELVVIDKIPGLISRLFALEAITEDFKDDFLAQSSAMQEQERRDQFFGYLFRRGMRGVLNFVKVLWEERPMSRDVIKIIEHIADRGYIPAENVIPRAEKAGYIPESSISATTLEVKKGQYVGGARIYDMSSKPRGYVLIINNEQFKDPEIYKPRQGSALDGDNLAALFTQLGFQLYTGNQFRNLTAQEMTQRIKEFSRDKLHNHASCSVVCILSHGTFGGQIAGVDGEHVKDTKVEAMFTASNCPALAKKPKLFFFVACRGENFDSGLTMADTLSKEESDLPMRQPLPHSPLARRSQSDTVVADARGDDSVVITIGLEEQLNSGLPQEKIPDFIDFFMVYTTIPGYKSYRHTEEGTWFVQEFVKVVSEEAHINDVYTMLVEVNNRISRLTTRDGEKQTIQMVSRLTKCVFFNPGY